MEFPLSNDFNRSRDISSQYQNDVIRTDHDFVLAANIQPIVIEHMMVAKAPRVNNVKG